MIQLLSTPISSIPLSPPTSPPVREAALPPVEAAVASSTQATTFVDPPTWRPYRSHLVRVVMTLPAADAVASIKPRRKSFSFGVGGSSDSTAAAVDKELVIDSARTVVTADNIEIALLPSDSVPFLRPAGSNLEKGGQSASTDRLPPLSPPSSPTARKKRLSFANALPFFGKGGEQHKTRGGGGDDSALDLEEHPDVGPDGVRQLRMKMAEQSPAAPATASMPVGGSVFAEAVASQDADSRNTAAQDWPLVVNGAPLAEIIIPLSQLSHSAVSMTMSRALPADKTAADSLNRTPATFTVNVPGINDEASPPTVGKDVYDGPVSLRVEFPSAFSGDTEAQTLLQMVQLALNRRGIKTSSEVTESSGLKLTRTISRGLTGRRKSSAGEEGRPIMDRPSAEDVDDHNASYWNAMRYQ